MDASADAPLDKLAGMAASSDCDGGAVAAADDEEVDEENNQDQDERSLRDGNKEPLSTEKQHKEDRTLMLLMYCFYKVGGNKEVRLILFSPVL